MTLNALLTPIRSDPPAASDPLRSAGLAMAEDMGAHWFSIIGVIALAIVATRRGDLDTAARHIEQCKAQWEGRGMKLLMS